MCRPTAICLARLQNAIMDGSSTALLVVSLDVFLVDLLMRRVECVGAVVMR